MMYILLLVRCPNLGHFVHTQVLGLKMQNPGFRFGFHVYMEQIKNMLH